MNQTYNPKLKTLSQNLRRRMTPEERRLWYVFLKKLPVTVNRQKVIGSYIADFYIASANLIIELDGSQHYFTKGQANDLERDKYFSDLGLRVLRFSNADVNENFDRVCEEIQKVL